MANFEINQAVPPQNEQDAKQVVYHLNDNPFGLPFSAKALTSLIIGVVFLAIVAAVATFIIISQRNNTENVPTATPSPTPNETISPTLAPSPTQIPQEFIIPSNPATPTPTLTTKLSPTKIPSSSTQNPFTSTKYGYSFQYPATWSLKNSGAVDSKTAELIGINPTSPVPAEAAIQVAVKNRTYEEEKAIGTGTTSSTTVNGTQGTKKVWTDGKGISYTKIIIPFNSQALIFVTTSAYETEFNQLLNTYSESSILGESTEADGGNPYINEE